MYNKSLLVCRRENIYPCKIWVIAYFNMSNLWKLKFTCLFQAEGKDCVYLYSDIKSGIVGTWKDGAMIQGKPAFLKNFTINSGMR